jgi:mannose-6-phosphate isomerase-like protein (cupin superfamily)
MRLRFNEIRIKPLRPNWRQSPRGSIMIASKVVATFVLIAGLATTARAQSPAGATYYPADVVDAAFAKGGPTVLLQTGNVRVLTPTRTQAGEAELHATESDIFYVVEGAATFVVGGTIAGAHETAPGETRGTSLDGGAPYQLKAGDVITIPAGVPHWFKATQGRFRYLVIKVGATK